MTEPPKTTQSERKPSLLNVLLTSGLVIGVLGWLFHMQGRAYHTANLGYYGLDSADFPLATSDLQWLTLIGWTEVSLRWFRNSDEVYLDMLWKTGLPVLASLLAAYWIFRLIFRFYPNLKNSLGRWRTKRSASSPRWYAWIWTRLKEVFAITAAVLASASLAPALLWVASLTVLVTVVFTLIPFDYAGRSAAEERCAKGLESLELLSLSDAYSDMKDARKLMCSDKQCAVISEGKLWTIPRSAILRSEVPRPALDKSGAPPAKSVGFCHMFERK